MTLPKLKPADLNRPERHLVEPVPALPEVAADQAEQASTIYSNYRTHLSNHRTGLSEHRTDLSEFRTDLSTFRTGLSTERTEMSMRRTGMSFQRTRLSADRTLMSIMRTALSFIGFGFTIFQVFSKFLANGESGLAVNAPRNFGTAMVALGILLLTFGIVYHVKFMIGLRKERHAMVEEGLLHGDSAYPVSLSLITAILLWLLGTFAIVSMVFNVAPFS